MDFSNDEDNRIDDSTDEDNFPYDMERFGEFLNPNNRNGPQPVVEDTENENADEDAVVPSNAQEDVVETTESGNAQEDVVVSSNVENAGEPAELNVETSVNADTEISSSLNISVGTGQTSEQQTDSNDFDLSPTYFPYDTDRFGEFMNLDRNEQEPTDGMREMEDENVAASRNEDSVTDDVAIPNLSNISVQNEEYSGQQSDSDDEQDPSPPYFPYDMDRFGEFLDPNNRNVPPRTDEASDIHGESAVVSSNEDNELVADAVEPANSSDISVERQSDPYEENLFSTLFHSDCFEDFNNNMSDCLYFKNDMPSSDGSQQTNVNPRNDGGDVEVGYVATDNIGLNNGVSSVTDDNVSKEYSILRRILQTAMVSPSTSYQFSVLFPL